MFSPYIQLGPFATSEHMQGSFISNEGIRRFLVDSTLTETSLISLLLDAISVNRDQTAKLAIVFAVWLTSYKNSFTDLKFPGNVSDI